jgi:hypothetical protein
MYQNCRDSSLSANVDAHAVTSADVVNRHDARRAYASIRLFWALVASGTLFILVLARWLTPDPSGLGTHVQLGLPPCAFHYFTSLPCPACGLTTAFAHMARLELTSAVHAHPLGVLLFMCTLLTLPRSVVACLRAESIEDVLQRLRVGPLAAMMAVAAFVTWIARIAAIVLT